MGRGGAGDHALRAEHRRIARQGGPSHELVVEDAKLELGAWAPVYIRAWTRSDAGFGAVDLEHAFVAQVWFGTGDPATVDPGPPLDAEKLAQTDMDATAGGWRQGDSHPLRPARRAIYLDAGHVPLTSTEAPYLEPRPTRRARSRGQAGRAARSSRPTRQTDGSAPGTRGSPAGR